MPTFAAPALNGAWGGGIENLLRLKQLSDLNQQQAGQADFINYLLQQNSPSAPTALNPPPGQSGQAQAAPAGPGPGPSPAQAPGGAAAPAGTQAPGGQPPTSAGEAPAASAGGASMVPGSIMAFVQAIKAKNPKASPKEVMDALETAMPFMDAQQKQQLDALKLQLQIYKTQADEDYKQGSLADRQKRTDAYVKHLKTIESRGDPKAMQAEGMKILAGRRQLTDRLSAINKLLQAGTDASGQPLTADQKQKLAKAQSQLQDAVNQVDDYYKAFQGVRAGAMGQQFESANPPPTDPDLPEDASGGSQ